MGIRFAFAFLLAKHSVVLRNEASLNTNHVEDESSFQGNDSHDDSISYSSSSLPEFDVERAEKSPGNQYSDGESLNSSSSTSASSSSSLLLLQVPTQDTSISRMQSSRLLNAAQHQRGLMYYLLANTCACIAVTQAFYKQTKRSCSCNRNCSMNSMSCSDVEYSHQDTISSWIFSVSCVFISWIFSAISYYSSYVIVTYLTSQVMMPLKGNSVIYAIRTKFYNA
jgi:hypothetical protein